MLERFGLGLVLGIESTLSAEISQVDANSPALASWRVLSRRPMPSPCNTTEEPREKSYFSRAGIGMKCTWPDV